MIRNKVLSSLLVATVLVAVSACADMSSLCADGRVPNAMNPLGACNKVNPLEPSPG